MDSRVVAQRCTGSTLSSLLVVHSCHQQCAQTYFYYYLCVLGCGMVCWCHQEAQHHPIGAQMPSGVDWNGLIWGLA